VPVGGFTVGGRSFATAKEADDYQLALALSRSLQEEQRLKQQQQLGGFFGRYLPNSGGGGQAQQQPQPQPQQTPPLSQRAQEQQQQLSGYPGLQSFRPGGL
jgi:hypothetical protein